MCNSFNMVAEIDKPGGAHACRRQRNRVNAELRTGFTVALFHALHNIAATQTMFSRPIQKTLCLLACALPLVSCGEKAAPADAAAKNSPAPMPVKSNADWPMFRGDAALTGVAPGELATPLKLLWR